MRKRPMRRATRLVIFSTALMMAFFFVVYVLLMAEAGATLALSHITLFVLGAIVAYTVASIIIDRVLNPMRRMTQKVNEIAQMDFSRPLTVDTTDDELREYAFQFNTMAAKLQSYIAAQRRFVADASHELATPITVINGHADMILRHGDTDPALTRESIATIRKEALRMGQLVDSLLYLARGDSATHKYEFAMQDIVAIAREAAEEARLITPAAQIEIESPPTIQTNCDTDAIRRVFRILLSNAVKFSGQQPQIAIRISRVGGVCTASVTDNGVGIAQAHLARIFERFYRVDDARTVQGSGLGLAIAREIIRAHGGEITAISPPAQGTTFIFKI